MLVRSAIFFFFKHCSNEYQEFVVIKGGDGFIGEKENMMLLSDNILYLIAYILLKWN